jgi:hypothetical protein
MIVSVTRMHLRWQIEDVNVIKENKWRVPLSGWQQVLNTWELERAGVRFLYSPLAVVAWFNQAERVEPCAIQK